MIITASMLTLCMASTAWYEARNQSTLGMTNVMEVVYQRALVNYREAKDECAVAKDPKQFSAFDNGYKMPSHEQSFLDLLPLAWKVYRGKIDNLPDNVLHYHATYANPDWALPEKFFTSVQDHMFYADVK